MPEAGGPANVAGVEFELWYTADKLVDLFFEEIISVKPQAKEIPIGLNEVKTASVDDIYIDTGSGMEFYNLKSQCSSNRWTFGKLKEQGVLKQFGEQFRKTPNAKLFFVSQTPCPLLSEVLVRGRDCESRKCLETKLDASDHLSQWEKIAGELGLSFEEMKKFARQIFFKQALPIEEIKISIKQRLTGHVTSVELAPSCLRDLAADAAIKRRAISRDMIVEHFEKHNIVLKAHLKVNDLVEQIKTASGSLSVASEAMILNRPIEREEVGRLLYWIDEPIGDKEKRIAVVTGGAGCGKTFILRELQKRLSEKGIPVLAIKTDLIHRETIKELSEELGLSEGIRESMAAIVEKHGGGVVLLDQIDALSLSMSKERTFINTYINLVSQLNAINGLKIVISCREYDLTFDPVLRNLNDKEGQIEEFKVSPLSEKQLRAVLETRKLDIDQLPSSLPGILSVPLHLKVFCDIYNTEMKIASIKTLQDLYEALWERKVNGIEDRALREDVRKTVDLIVARMDQDQTISVPSVLLDENLDGGSYLKSQSIIIEHSRKFQFFHSTFFDFCFARSFVLCVQSLFDYVSRNEQGLFIRSQVRQVMEFLRESDSKRYLKELRNFLVEPGIRYHIRLLVLDQLAFLEEPTDSEWKIVKRVVLSGANTTISFLNGIQHQKWLEYLIDCGYLKKFLLSGDEKLKRIVTWKLGMLINSCFEVVISFLLEFPGIEKKEEKVADILSGLNSWQDDRALGLFEEYKENLKRTHSYRLLRKRILRDRPDFFMDFYFEEINERIDKIESPNRFKENEFLSFGEKELFLDLLKWNSEKAIPRFLAVLFKLVQKTKVTEDRNGLYYRDEAFGDMEHRIANNHIWTVRNSVTRKLQILAGSDKCKFYEYMKPYNETKSWTINKIFLDCYIENPELYVDEGFAFLIREGTFETMPYGARTIITSLIRCQYPLFSDKQKADINQLIMDIAPEWEQKTIAKGYNSRIRHTKAMYLNAIPDTEISKFPDLKKEFQELNRKFGGSIDSRDISMHFGPVASPLPFTAYEKMTLDHWRSSMKKYNETTEPGGSGSQPFKGGICEHSRSFSKEVEKRPNYFYKFILEIGDDEDISDSYLTAGLDGLIEAKFEPGNIRELIKRFWEKKDQNLRTQVIRAIEYIGKVNKLDLEMIKILEEYAVNDPDPEPGSWGWEEKDVTDHENDQINVGINTIRGSAAMAFGRHCFETDYPDELFSIFEKITEEKSVSVRACLIHGLYGMLNFDREKTLSIFLKLTEDLNPEVIFAGINTLSYLMTKAAFPVLIPKIRSIFAKNNSKIGELLMVAYVRGYPGSLELLEEGIEANDANIEGIIDFASRYLLSDDEDLVEKSRALFLRFLNDESETVLSRYDWFFHDFDPQDFDDLFDCAFHFCKSKAIKKSSHYFWEFLKTCVRDEPEKCLDLVENYYGVLIARTDSERVEIEPVGDIILEVMNKTSEEVYRVKALDIFDSFLQNPAYQSWFQRVLKKYDEERNF